ncbi:MAG: hypothetical protein Rhims3KO_09630 [Hyphomicrobiales bacterium]
MVLLSDALDFAFFAGSPACWPDVMPVLTGTPETWSVEGSSPVSGLEEVKSKRAAVEGRGEGEEVIKSNPHKALSFKEVDHPRLGDASTV